MFFESFLLNCIVIVALVLALIYDYITKFFGYWYVRNIPYKIPIPCFGSDYLRVLGLQDTTNVVNNLYNQHPKEKFVGYIKGRIPDLIVRDLDTIQHILSTDFAHFDNKGLCLDKSPDICIRNNLFYLEGENWTLLREQIEAIFKNSARWDLVCDKIKEEYCEQNTGKVNINKFLANIMDKLLADHVVGHDTVEIIKDLRVLLQNRSLKNKLKNYLKTIFPSIYILFRLSTLPISFLIKAQKMLNFKANFFQEKLSEFYNFLKNNKEYKKTDAATSILAAIINEAYTPCYYIIISILYELSKNIVCQRKARVAIELSEKSVGVSEKGNEDYLDRVIKEAIRLHPPYSIIHRRCTEGYKIPNSDIVIDKGVTVSIPVEAVHKDEFYYDKPEIFEPDRFLSEKVNKHPFSYFPFGGGPRKCPGAELAHAVIRGILTVILKRYNLESCSINPGRLVYEDYNFQRVLAQDLWLNITDLKD